MEKLAAESLNQLYEIGNVNVPSYEFRKAEQVPDENKKYFTIYNFTTEDGDIYTVRFFNLREIHQKRYKLPDYQLEFDTGGENGDTLVVNKGRFFKIMSTIIDITKDFLSTHDFRSIKISPSENFRGDKRRFNIYQRYIEKNIPPEYSLKKGWWGDLFIKNTEAIKSL